jgi:hypothetical protein
MRYYAMELKATDFSQGTAYSCQTIAAIGVIANTALGLKKLQGICKPVGDGFEITFAKYPEVKVRIDNQELTAWTKEFLEERELDFRERIERIKEILPAEKFHWILPRLRPQHVSGDRLVRVLELAYARLMLTLRPSAYPDQIEAREHSDLRLYQHQNFHHDPALVINDMTNWPVQVTRADDGPQPDFSQSFAEKAKMNEALSVKILSELKATSDHPEKYLAVVSSVGVPGNSFVYLDPGNLIVPYHDYIVKSVDAKQKNICLLDPFSSRIGLLLNYDDFLEYFNIMAKATALD